MPSKPPLDELESLRRRHTELSVENAQLRGRGAASRGNIEMLKVNTDLRRRVEQLRCRLPKADLGPAAAPDAWLTVHQVASLLNTTAEHASRLLAKVETQLDNNGLQVLSRERFEQFVVDTATGTDPSRFL
jgi:hypothetical protein